MIIYQATPDYYNEYIKHYGVMGMKWGIRKDLRRTGSISEKTKRKMKKALSTASYRKTRRMLNGLEDLKSDYRSRIEEHRGKNKNDSYAKMRTAKSNLSKVEGIQSQWKNSAKKKRYNYDTIKNVTRYSDKSRRGAMIGNILGGVLGSSSAVAYQNMKHKKYTKKTGGKTSQYIDTSGVYYKKKKK